MHVIPGIINARHCLGASDTACSSRLSIDSNAGKHLHEGISVDASATNGHVKAKFSVGATSTSVREHLNKATHETCPLRTSVAFCHGAK